MTFSPSDTAEAGPTVLSWRRAAAFMASPAIIFYTLPWLMILLVIGTVAQKDIGLYQAQALYFSAWIVWLGPLPLPGTALTLAAITLCLLAKFLLYSPWRAHQAGIILSHFGVLVLLIGGLVTAVTQREGFIALAEGARALAVSDYHARVFTVTIDGETAQAIPYDDLRQGETLDTPLPFKIRIDSVCANCRPAPVTNAETRKGLAAQIDLRGAPPEKDAEINLSGVTFGLSGANEAIDGIYAVMEDIPHGAAFELDGKNYVFAMERAARPLPFEIELIDFKRDLHPGTDMARGFSSDIIVHDGAVRWPATIRMNEPLRYKGYTLYQASFSVRPDGEYSVLSVVANQGRVLPYVASALIFAGLLLHLVLRARARNAG